MENVVQNQYLLEARNSSAFVWEFLKSCFFFFFPKRMGAHSFTKCSAICNLSDIDSTKTPTVFQSGTIEVKVAGGTLTDKATNTNNENILNVGFIDVLKPDIQYISQDIDEINDTYTMTFEVTDKYYASGELDLDDLTIKMQNGQVDSNGNAIIYDLRELQR